MSLSEEADLDAWGQLVSITDIDSPPIFIKKEKFTIGRARGCDVSLAENKLVSSCHCYIQRDDQGKVWLYDSSTNGTLLNMSVKLTKGECRELNHGDEFFVVYKKNNEEFNVGYIFQDTAKLREEENSENEATQEYSANQTIFDEEVNVAESSTSRKRTRSDVEDEEPESKQAKTESADSSQATLPVSSLPDEATAGKAVQQAADSTVPDADKDQGGKEEKGDEEKGSKEKAEKKVQPEEKDAMAEVLICIICQEILHDCISLQPCMHSFCSGCYSEWMVQSDECPSCRMKVERINKNHIVNNLVEAYLLENPDKKRSEEDLKELDAKNKITRDMLYPKNPRRPSESSEDYSDSDIGTDSESEQAVATYGPLYAGNLFGFGTPVFGNLGPQRTVCRQCPNYVEPPTPVPPAATCAGATATTDAGSSGAQPSAAGTSDSNATAASDQPSTSGVSSTASADGKRMPTPPQYRCRANQNHVLCQCCLHPMPERRAELLNDPNGVQQQCALCYRAFCHAYWGCRKASCNGCLDKLRDMNFGEKALTNLILENHYESNILKEYLTEKKITVRDMLQVCITMMEAGRYICIDQIRLPNGADTYLCYPCALRNFRSLAYQYREDIPRDQLPAAVTSRPDCYWGKNCRTQRNKPAHAQRFNHICGQIRT